MFRTTQLLRRRASSDLVSEILPVIIKHQQFDASLAAAVNTDPEWTTETVTEVLRSIPRFFFQSSRSIGRQSGTLRHRTALRQRSLHAESEKLQNGDLVLGPAAYRDPAKMELGLSRSIQFFFWVERYFNFSHNESTVKEMAIVIAKSNNLRCLWDFLKEISRRDESGGVVWIVTTTTMTCLMKVLGEEGLVNEAVRAFYRMKQFHCKPDVYAYNTVILALCRVGFFKKAKFFLEQMELPGFRCPPDKYTYTILISSYCKFSMQTGARKATRRRMWEANHLFRIMLYKGFVPDVVTYNCLIDGCCKTYRIERALELFEDMSKRGCSPNRVTYNSFIRYYSAVNEIDKAIQMLRRMQEMNHGTPTTSSYTPIIHSLREGGRVLEARDFLLELVNAGSVPREYTYKLVSDALESTGEANLLDKGSRRKIEDGIVERCKQVMRVKPVMNRRGSAVAI